MSLGLTNPEYIDALKSTRNELQDIISQLDKAL
jgi:hypothetical protein